MSLNACMATKADYPKSTPPSEKMKTAHGIPRKTESGITMKSNMSYEDMLLNIGNNKDRASFIALFEYFAPRLKSFLMKGGMDAGVIDELIQDTFLTIWRRAGTFNPAKAKASTWIFTIARNKKIDYLRKQKGISVELSDAVPLADNRSEHQPAENLIHIQETDVLYSAIQNLPDEQADLIRKSFYEDKSHGEIAQETGIPLGTVKSRLRLALGKLRKETNIQDLWT